MRVSFDLSTLAGTTDAAKIIAKRYRDLTGKPLGITGEIGELVGAQLLGLRLVHARQPGFDAIGPDGTRVQIKTRCILHDSKPGQRMGSVKLDREWDTVVLVLLNEEFEPLAVYEAQRPAVENALREPGSKARNERGALSVSKFRSIAELRWEQTPAKPDS